ncbi:hypothetical protein Lupro_07980 [Lutibacter profundi]|uniref:Fibronectin type-III domain-containing protein n=1 Tax=Lutibacter profundi TaxID=1622118 RepID=A0A109RNM7_9FLAO|nr:hypothetical protein [Lutibacter profundi]AMC11197.1 hypothetical protein Lupro_07980 [Lutibacter profundi]
MKKILYTLALSTLIWSCGGGGEDTPPPSPTPTNNAPTVPTLVYPTNNLLCIDNVLDFDWNASTDSDGDAITYQVQVAKDVGFTQLTHTVTESATLRTLSLEKGIAYYWRVKATDSKNLSSAYSTTNQFYTEGEGVSNYLPFSPILVAPTLNLIVTSATTTLQWTADDVNTTDTLTYDVYFGTNQANLSIASADQTETSFETPTLTASTAYFWKVVVKDNQGGQTIGQIWNFVTD